MKLKDHHFSKLIFLTYLLYSNCASMQSVVARLCGEPSSVVSDSEFIHEEIRQQQRRCICPSRFPVQKVDNGKYKVQLFYSFLALWILF